jgi:acetylornithine deacetylase
MNEREASVLTAIDVDGLIQTLSELIAFESCHGREVAVQQKMAALLEELGLETDVWEIDIDALKQHPAYGAEIERERALGVVGRWGAGRGRKLILNGHVDVVPAGDLARWTVPPFQGTVRDGRVYGRGSVDMKGGLCCALYAVKALRQAGVEVDGSLLIQSVVGEEDGGLGTLAAVTRGYTADAAIVLEPTELVVAPAQAGALSFRVTIPGRAAHGALRTEGADPLAKFGLIYDALAALERERNRRLVHPLFTGYPIPFAICVGKVHAGIWASTVAEELVLEGRYGVGIGEQCRQAEQELEATIAAVALEDEWLRHNPPVVEWWGARFQPAAIPADHPLVTTLAGSLAAVTQRQTAVRGMPYGADMHLLINQGHTPTVLFGPGDVRAAHAPDEFVPITELEAATRALALTIMRFCSAT